MSWLVTWLIKRGLSQGAAKWAGRGILVLLIVGAIGFVIWRALAALDDYGDQREKAGGTTVALANERQHSATVAEARKDERGAQIVSDVIGIRQWNEMEAAQIAVARKMEEMRDALAAKPADPKLPYLLPDRVRDASNALVDRANRAARYAGPADGPDENRDARSGDGAAVGRDGDDR